MTLLKTTSGRLDNSGRPWIDYYLGYVYEGHVYLVRVKPQFARDYVLMFANAVNVPSGEKLENYVS